ncbi:MAG: ARMT1-like domain-containing protein, partial [Candidatus Hermodarchaeota archaeon]
MPDEISVPLVPECSACMIESLKILIPLLAAEEKEQHNLYSLAFSRLSEGFSKQLDPIEISVSLYRELYDKVGVKDPYSALKKQSIKAAKRVVPTIEKLISGLEGPEKLRAALAASIAGNVIDFNTAGHDPDLNNLRGVFEGIFQSGFAIDDSSLLWESLTTRKGKMLFLGDNAGETLFDIPLVRLVTDLGWDVTYVVKMRPMVNDAVEEDV